MSQSRKPLLDSSVMIERKTDLNATLIEKMRLSIVVLYELTATTIRKSDFQELDFIRQTFHNRGDLLIPTMSDWWETAKMIRRLRFGEKTMARGKTPKIPGAHRLQNDALIARSASLHNCFIVTTNINDFNMFTPFMEKLEVVSADDFFA